MSSLNRLAQEAKEARETALELAEEYLVGIALNELEQTFVTLKEEISPENKTLSSFNSFCNQVLSKFNLLFAKPLIIAAKKYCDEKDLNKISNSFRLIQSVSHLLGVSAEEIFEEPDMDEITDTIGSDSLDPDSFYEELDNFMTTGEEPRSSDLYYKNDFIFPLVKLSDSLKFNDENIDSIIELIKVNSLSGYSDTDLFFIGRLLGRMFNKTFNNTLLFKLIYLKSYMYYKIDSGIFISFNLPKDAKFKFCHLREVFQVDSLEEIDSEWQVNTISHLLSHDLIEENLTLEIKLSNLTEEKGGFTSEGNFSITVV